MWGRRAFCIMNLRVAFAGEAKGKYARSRSERESEHGVPESAEADAKPSDLPLGRVKDV